MTIQQILKDRRCPKSCDVSNNIKRDIQAAAKYLATLIKADPKRARPKKGQRMSAYEMLDRIENWLDNEVSQ